MTSTDKKVSVLVGKLEFLSALFRDPTRLQLYIGEVGVGLASDIDGWKQDALREAPSMPMPETTPAELTEPELLRCARNVFAGFAESPDSNDGYRAWWAKRVAAIDAWIVRAETPEPPIEAVLRAAERNGWTHPGGNLRPAAREIVSAVLYANDLGKKLRAIRNEKCQSRQSGGSHPDGLGTEYLDCEECDVCLKSAWANEVLGE